jgi:hypothetical protein
VLCAPFAYQVGLACCVPTDVATHAPPIESAYRDLYTCLHQLRSAPGLPSAERAAREQSLLDSIDAGRVSIDGKRILLPEASGSLPRTQMRGFAELTGDSILVLIAAGCSWRVLNRVVQLLLPDVDVSSLSPGWLSIITPWGMTPLHEAARWGCLTCFAALFQDLQTRGSQLWEQALLRAEARSPGLSLLHEACTLSQSSSLQGAHHKEALRENSHKIVFVFVRAVSNNELLTAVVEGRSAVVGAALSGLVPVLELLKTKLPDAVWTTCLRTGPSVKEVPGTHYRRTALSEACKGGNTSATRFLLTEARWSAFEVAAAMFEATSHPNKAVVVSRIFPQLTDALRSLCSSDSTGQAQVADSLEGAAHIECSSLAGADGTFHRLTGASPATLGLLGRVVSRIVGWQPLPVDLVTVLRDLGAPVVPCGPLATLRIAIMSGNVQAVEFVRGLPRCDWVASTCDGAAGRGEGRNAAHVGR